MIRATQHVALGWADPRMACASAAHGLRTPREIVEEAWEWFARQWELTSEHTRHLWPRTPRMTR